MRVLFCGSGTFALLSLRSISESGHEVVAVITQPARPVGRSSKPRPTPIALAAADSALDVKEWADINSSEAVNEIRQIAPDVICVVDFGQLIKAPVRSSAAVGAFNLHASLLPELRGAAPINWAIIRGHRRTGVTTFSLVDRMDAGPIYAQDQMDISPNETAEELRERLAGMGAELVCRTLELLGSGPIAGQPQDESKASAAPRLKKADGLIDFSRPAEQIRNLIHGTWEWPGAQGSFRRTDGRTVNVIIARASVEPGATDAAPGTLDAELCVATGDGRLRIEQIKPTGKRLMRWEDFVNGYHPSVGDRFAELER